MLGTSFTEFVLIRSCIFVLQYTTPICLSVLAILLVAGGRPALTWPASLVLLAYSFIDLLYYLFVWIPYNRRLKDEARHPPSLSPEDRRALFIKVADHISDFERYLQLWFLGADRAEIRRDNVRDFMFWAFFDTAPENATKQDIADADEYVDLFEERLGREIEPGRGNARGLRLTLDGVETRYRSFIWFVIVGGVDLVAHCQFAWNGFQYHAQPRSEVFSVTPPRLQSIVAGNRSPSKQLAYWYRPHTAPDKVPMVFLHGIGIGLWTYVPFLSRLNRVPNRSGDIGVIAIEILPVSFRMTSDPLGKLEFLSQLDAILDSHGWDKFVLAAHSYGTVLASHMIHSQTFNSRIQGVVLLDPVSIMLHLPDVAYNFTRRKPRWANEWQLWYFASMDPGVAHALGRHFFWRENIIWKEELLALPGNEDEHRNSTTRKRNVAVALSERDLIVDTLAVADYLADGEDWVPGKSSNRSAGAGSYEEQRGNHHSTRDGIEVLWFPGLDHSQMFDKKEDEERVCDVIRQYCKR
ncbi:alpha beta hydrolase fold family [Seiridium cupressi]